MRRDEKRVEEGGVMKVMSVTSQRSILGKAKTGGESVPTWVPILSFDLILILTLFWLFRFHSFFLVVAVAI